MGRGGQVCGNSCISVNSKLNELLLVIHADINTVLSPYLVYEVQGNMKNIQLGVYWEEEKYGMIGIGGQKDQYNGLSVSALLLHLGVNLTKGGDRGWKIGYTCEVPTNQGTIYKNTSHALSLHWYFKKNKERCTNRFDHSPNNKKTKVKRIWCIPRWFGRH